MTTQDSFDDGEALGEHFLRTFTNLERWMRRQLRKDEGYPFKRLVDDLRSKTKVTEAQALQLSTYGYLRNALAHWEPSAHGVAIADPRPETVADFDALAQRVMEPVSALSAIGPQVVMSVQEDDTVEDFLSIVREYDYSQVPVLASGMFSGVLTVGALARWIAVKRWHPAQDFRRARISSVPTTGLGDAEFLEFAPNLSAPEALAAFDVELEGRPIAGIVVVDRGVAHPSVEAMILPWDLPALLRATQA
ncbi:CBS domain-containing protein [Glaciibacter sp. 2TAF33]|uniref:CBS domain-containing protein n=1 Tax=Glaciibacter sp. 2TAF33 TaxID=3233015 RepID=UPI003F8DC402